MKLTKFFLIACIGLSIIPHPRASGGINHILNRHPIYSPDGNFVAFQSNINGNFDIIVFDLINEEYTNLTREHLASAWFPAWSPDSKYLSFISDESGNQDIWIASIDDTEIINLTLDDANANVSHTWSSDGQYLAYDSEDASGLRTDIFIYDFETKTSKQITDVPNTSYANIQWLNDQHMIMFTKISAREGLTSFREIDSPDDLKDEGIWIMSLTGDTQLLFLMEGGFHKDLVISPDNAYIFASINVNNRTDIFRISSQASYLNLTQTLGIFNYSPQVSPDGVRIAFYSMRNNSIEAWDIFVVDVDGTNLENLTQYINVSNVNPNWSLDSSKIAFESYFNPDILSSEILILDINARRITSLSENITELREP